MAQSQKEQWVIPTYNGIQYTKYLISTSGRLVSKTNTGPNRKSRTAVFDNYKGISNQSGVDSDEIRSDSKRYYKILNDN
jgi:hypothetical protein